MSKYAALALATWCCCVLAALADKEPDMKVEVTYVPEVCQQKSKSGDQLTMHYTGTLDSGAKFDSRSVTASGCCTVHRGGRARAEFECAPALS